MAVRDWQLRHGGRFPDKLDDLVPDELPSLPLDPYTGRPFGYTTYALVKPRRSKESPYNWPPETRLIYMPGPTAAMTAGCSTRLSRDAGRHRLSDHSPR